MTVDKEILFESFWEVIRSQLLLCSYQFHVLIQNIKESLTWFEASGIWGTSISVFCKIESIACIRSETIHKLVISLTSLRVSPRVSRKFGHHGSAKITDPPEHQPLLNFSKSFESYQNCLYVMRTVNNV